MKNYRKKAAFFDIDGTILDYNNHIPASTIDGIHKLQAKGNYAFLCTGRSRAFVKDEALLNIGFDGIISGCGTMIEFHDEVLYYKKLDMELIKKTLAFFKENRIAVVMEGRYHMYVDETDFGGDAFVARLRSELGEELLPITGSEADWEASKFSCVTKYADMSAARPVLEQDYELMIHDSTVMEVVPKDCSKGTGILKVCEKLGIAVEDTYAFGDSVNDLPMFETAGHSIAMGNGAPYVKQQASYVTDSLHDDGIYHALEHFSLF